MIRTLYFTDNPFVKWLKTNKGVVLLCFLVDVAEEKFVTTFGFLVQLIHKYPILDSEIILDNARPCLMK